MQHEERNGVDLRRYRSVIEQARLTLRQNLAITRTPCYLDACIGREPELQQLHQWLRQPHAPLLTLTGVSGIGKTHLACEFLRRAQQAGVRCIYVNLTLLQTADEIIPAVFHALNTPFPGETVWKRLASSIFEQGVLLVLDDFYGLLPEGARVVQELISAAPALKILATSQEPLGIPEETLLPLPPLPVPSLQGESLESLRRNPCVAIVLSQAGSNLQLTRSNAAQIARLCADLGGYPGRLVDAGLYLRRCKWIQFYSQYRFWFGLAPSGPMKPETQRHLLHSMLLEEEKRILRSLSVFPETFDGAAGAAAANIGERAIKPLLDKLLECGFLQKAHEKTSVRYRIRPQMRTVILSLKEEERSVVMQRLHAYYRQRLQPNNWSRQSAIDPREWCYAECYTLQHVLDYLKERGDSEGIAELFQLLDGVCGHRPPAMLLDWGVQYLNLLTEHSQEDSLRVARSMLISLIGSGVYTISTQLLEMLGDSDENAALLGRYWHDMGDGKRAAEFYMRAIAYAESRRQREQAVLDAVGLAESEAVIGNLDHADQILRELKARYPVYRMSSVIRSWYYYVDAYVHYQRGKFVRSRELYEVALRHGTRNRDVWRELSRVYLELGKYAKARAYATKALQALLADVEPHEASVYAVRSCLGDVDAVQGRYDDALAHHAAAWEFWRAQGQPRWMCWTLNRLAEIELLARDARHRWRLAPAFSMSAQECLNEAWAIIEPTFLNLPHRSRTQHNLGWLAWHEGRLDEAEDYLNQALEIRQSYGNLYGVARTLEALARVRFSQQRYQAAVELLDQASAIRESLDAKPYLPLKKRNLSIRRSKG